MTTNSPTFSIAQMLCATAYIAVAIAAIAYPLSALNYLSFYLWIAVIVSFGVHATGPRTRKSVFCAATFVTSLAYVAAAGIENAYPAELSHSEYTRWQMPHHLVGSALIHIIPFEGHAGEAALKTAIEDIIVAPRNRPVAKSAQRRLLRPFAIQRWAIVNTALCVGLSVGLLVSWRYARAYRSVSGIGSSG